ncbi:uncharacterized protein LOC104903560 [Beta vulgaris subsp. vulgaris]|uniref:uncharacterized protein LOC104903560 n=1 Tax=Beta vulgaris subsp. vulgaris TaxID=3555 RepID=UPI00053FE805|nr:uncharacterized protein LOC104903560 [Beta vulgaris subsp. vulgaris]
MDKPQYNAWATLFRNTARAYQVLDHIDSSVTRPSDVDDELWSRLDSIVLTWLYGPINEDLLLAILDDKATALVAWDKLRALFQDNKGTRIVHLENQFGNIKMQDFSSSVAFCQSLKSVADQLSSLGHPVSDERLVLQLVAGLTDEYDTVATFIQQSQPLPSFQNARSMIALEETRRNNTKKSGTSSSAVLVAADPAPTAASHSSFYGHRGGR